MRKTIPCNTIWRVLCGTAESEKGFFDHIDHEWMMKFLEWNIQDKNLLWLIRKYLKAGIMEQGKFEPTEEGSAQV